VAKANKLCKTKKIFYNYTTFEDPTYLLFMRCTYIYNYPNYRGIKCTFTRIFVPKSTGNERYISRWRMYILLVCFICMERFTCQ